MSDLDKRAKEYAKNTEFVEVNYYLKKRYSEKQIKQAYKDGATQETALLSQHILDLQKDKGNLTDKVRELEAQIEKMKSDVISKRDKAKRSEAVITYTVLNNILVKWEIKEK